MADISQIKLPNGDTFDLVDEKSGYLTEETDPVFSASPAAGITSTDISNWNAKVSDDKTWNGVSLSKSTTSSASSYYLPSLSSTSGTTAYLYQATNKPTNNAIAKYDGSAYLKSTTPSANDNSTKVATTAYVDAAIPDVSSFSTTDEKLSVNGITSGQTYYLIMGQAPALSPNTRQWDTTGLKYYGSAGTTNSTGVSRITLGNSTAMGTTDNKQGILKLYGINSYAVELRATDIVTSDKTIELPNKSGKVALTSDIPSVYSSTNTGGYLTMATLPIYDGTVE